MSSSDTEIVTKLSPRSTTETVTRLTEMVSAKGMKLFAVIDQAAEARQVGLELRDTVMVIFGSPTAGTPVMVASPLAALDLPLKVLIWADGDQTKVSYFAPDALASRYNLDPDLAGNLLGINALKMDLWPHDAESGAAGHPPARNVPVAETRLRGPVEPRHEPPGIRRRYRSSCVSKWPALDVPFLRRVVRA